MLPIPQAWQSSFGGPAMTGNCCLSIISRTSLGPALAVFNPADVGTVTPVPAKQVLAYPIAYPTLGDCSTTTGTIFNCMMVKTSMVWPEGTRSLLFFHHVCDVTPVYPGGGWSCPGNMVTRILAYDANDLLAVKNGQKQPWDVLPYANWTVGGVLANSRVESATYDPATGRIFVSERWGDPINTGQPKIHVYRVPGATGTPPPPPPSDTTLPTVSITSPSSGSTVSGTITVSANATDNVGVAGVQFKLDGNSLGSEDISSPYSTSWNTSVSTGSHTLTATARDAVGNTTTSSSVTVTIQSSTPTPTPICGFTRDLYLKSRGGDVRCFQKYLNSTGFIVSSSGIGAPGNESDYFGSATKYAVSG